MDAASFHNRKRITMAKPTFNFGFNKKPRGGKKPRKGSGKKPSTSSGKSRSNAWRSYISNAPIPD